MCTNLPSANQDAINDNSANNNVCAANTTTSSISVNANEKKIASRINNNSTISTTKKVSSNVNTSNGNDS